MAHFLKISLFIGRDMKLNANYWVNCYNFLAINKNSTQIKAMQQNKYSYNIYVKKMKINLNEMLFIVSFKYKIPFLWIPNYSYYQIFKDLKFKNAIKAKAMQVKGI